MSMFVKKASGPAAGTPSAAAAILLAAAVALIGFVVLAAGILSSCGGGGGGGGGTTYSIMQDPPTIANGRLDFSHARAAEGATVTITATPEDETYTLTNGSIKVIEDGGSGTVTPSGSGNIWTFIMPAFDVLVRAAFEYVDPGNHLIATSVPGGHGTISTALSSDAGTPVSSADNGDGITLTVTPDTNYRLKAGSLKVVKTGDVDTTVPVTGSSSPYTFTMPDYDVTVSAEFEAKTYDIDKNSMTGGGVAVAASAAYGSTVTLTIQPDQYYRLKAGTLKVTETSGIGTVSVTGSGSSYKFIMPAYKVTVSAEFEVAPNNSVKQFTLTGITNVQKAEGYSYVLFGLFPPGTSVSDVQAACVAFFGPTQNPNTAVVAYSGGSNQTLGGSDNNWTLGPYAMYFFDDNDILRLGWRGYGTYDAWFALRDAVGTWTGYKKANLVVGGNVSRPASEFVKTSF